MSRRGGHWAGLERPIAWCDVEDCRNRNARVGKDGRRLCRSCRADARKTKIESDREGGRDARP